jgi:spore coat polysaccharide biosynthesis protein SpsF
MKTSSAFATAQEEFWAGDFGTEYVRRTPADDHLAANVALLERALRRAGEITDCIEFGANVGINLRALQMLRPRVIGHAVEINRTAAEQLTTVIPAENVRCTSVLDFDPPRTFALVLSKGLLIHIDPEHLGKVYRTLYRSARRYILICEYYNPAPVGIDYRGYKDRLFKRDFCGDMLDAYPDLKLLDYGFVYRRDPMHPQDDVTWFLMEKASLQSGRAQGP